MVQPSYQSLVADNQRLREELAALRDENGVLRGENSTLRKRLAEVQAALEASQRKGGVPRSHRGRTGSDCAS